GKPNITPQDHGYTEARRLHQRDLHNKRLWSTSPEAGARTAPLVAQVRSRMFSEPYMASLREPFSVKTSWDALRTGRVSDALPNGFQLFPSSARLSFDGEPRSFDGPVLVHNKNVDPKLRDLLTAAREGIESSGIAG